MFRRGAYNNRIDYLYVENNFYFEKDTYQKLKDKIEEKHMQLLDGKYQLSSFYIYKKTDVINEHYNKGTVGLDGHNRDLLAYVRYGNGKMDIFYVLKDGNVIYDLLQNRQEGFEFED